MELILHLLDGEGGKALHTWRFEDRPVITIGRAQTNDVVVTDPYVSRSHAQLDWSGEKWMLTSLSPHGILVHNQTWTELPLNQGMMFRLGQHGCFLRFGEIVEEHGDLKTMSFEATAMPIFTLDKARMQREVEQIADAEYFRRLKSAAQKLREQDQAVEQSVNASQTRLMEDTRG